MVEDHPIQKKIYIYLTKANRVIKQIEMWTVPSECKVQWSIVWPWSHQLNNFGIRTTSRIAAIENKIFCTL